MQQQNLKPLAFVNTDGVLTSAADYWLLDKKHRNPADAVNPTAVRLLAKFCAEAGAEVVMATAWDRLFLTAEAWRTVFRERAGVEVPVVDLLSFDERFPKGGATKSWADLMEQYMKDHPGRPYGLLEDNPDSPDNPRVVAVDAHTGLSTVNLLQLAHLLVPDSPLVRDLAGVNRSFSPDMAFTIGFRGNTVSTSLRDLDKALDTLGIPTSQP